MYEVICLIDEVVAVSIPIMGKKVDCIKKAIDMCVARGYNKIEILAVKDTMTRVAF